MLTDSCIISLELEHVACMETKETTVTKGMRTLRKLPEVAYVDELTARLTE